MMLTFRQLFDPQSSTYTYLLGDTRRGEALLIDTVFEQARRDMALLRELELELVATLETHVHADHVTGAWLLKQETGSAIVLSTDSGAQGADRYVSHGDRIQFGSRWLEVRATPGHTHGHTSYVLRLQEREVLIAMDAIYTMRTLDEGVLPHKMADEHQFRRSLKEIQRYRERTPGALIIPGHDWHSFSALDPVYA